MSEHILEDPEEVTIAGETVTVSALWNGQREMNPDGMGYGGMDLAFYLSGGMSIWPCLRSFQEGERDGFTEDSGPSHCECAICKRVRKLIIQENSHPYLNLQNMTPQQAVINVTDRILAQLQKRREEGETDLRQIRSDIEHERDEELRDIEAEH